MTGFSILIIACIAVFVIAAVNKLNTAAPIDKPSGPEIRRATDEFMTVFLMGEFLRFIHSQLERDYEDQYRKTLLVVEWVRETPTSYLVRTSEIDAVLPYAALFPGDVSWIDKVKTLKVAIDISRTTVEMTLWKDDTIYQYPVSNIHVTPVFN